GLGDERCVGGASLFEFALLVGDHAFGFELSFFCAARLLGRDDVRVGLGFGGGLSPARVGHFGLDDFDVERIEDEPQIRELARTCFANNNRERIVVVFGG